MINLFALCLALLGFASGTYAAWTWFGAGSLQLVIGETYALASGGVYISSREVMEYLHKVGDLNRRASIFAIVAILCSSGACLLTTSADFYLS